MHPTISGVTDRVRKRSEAQRSAYLARIRRAANDGPARSQTSCSNLAHAMAAAAPGRYITIWLWENRQCLHTCAKTQDHG